MQKKPDDTKASKRILLVAPSPAGRGGISSMVNALYHSQLAEEYSLFWLVSQDDRGKLRNLLTFIAAWIQAPWKMFRADLVHIHTASYNSFRRKTLLVLWAILLRKKYILHIHGGGFPVFMQQTSSLMRKLYLLVLRRAAAIVTLAKIFESAVSQYSPEQLDQKHFLLPNPGRFPLQEPHDCAIEPVTILFCGWLEPAKGVFDLLKAFAQCADSDWQLVMAGKGQIAEVRQAADELKIGNQVKILAWQTPEQLSELYKKSTVLVLPSYTEGMPMVILEAMSFGLPVISTPVGAIPEMLPEKARGFLHQAGDINKLSNLLTTLVKDIQLREELSREMQQHFAENYTREKVQEQVSGIYHKTVAARI